MKLSKRTTLWLLVMIIFINIVIRYPRIPHEIGADSFLIHSYSNTIMELGQMPWIRHPMSYLGLYPNSYPMAGPVLLATFSGLSGINMETTILLVSGFLGLFGCLGAFMLAGSVIQDDRFKLLVAFGYSTSPLLLKYTMWTFSTRVMLFAFLPLFLWAVLSKLDEIPENKVGHYVIAGSFLLAIATSHRLFWMALFFALIMIYFNMLMRREKLRALFYLPKKIKITILRIFLFCFLLVSGLLAAMIMIPSIRNISVVNSLVSLNPLIFFLVMIGTILGLMLVYVVRREYKLRRVAGIGIAGALLSVFLIQYTVLAQYRSSWYIRQIAPGFVDISSMLGEIVALGVVLGARYGLLLIPAFFGLVYVLVVKRVEAKTICIVAALTIFIPFLHYAMYFHESMFVLFILIAGIFLLTFLEDHNNLFAHKKIIFGIFKQRGYVVVILFLCGTLVFSAYTTIYRTSNIDEDTGFGNVMTADTYNAGLYSDTMNFNITGGSYINRVISISGQNNNLAYSVIVWERRAEFPSLSDIHGWYVFLKQPYGTAEVYIPPADWPVHVIPSGTTSEYKNVRYILFRSSDTSLVSVTEGW